MAKSMFPLPRRLPYFRSPFNFPVTVTLGKNNTAFWMRVKACKYEENYKPGAITIDTTFSMTQGNWNNFLELLTKVNFWSLHAETNDSGLDGSEWILEGTKEGQYYFVTRWSPDESRYPDFRACCDYLRSLARKSVDFHHQF